MNKIKVLHIIKSLGRGGAEMLLPETLKLHDKDKFEFHYIYFLPWKNQMVEEIKKNGGHITCLNANNNIQIILKVKQVIDYVRKHNIQLIHCHLPWAGFLGRLVHKLIRIPVIYTEHNKQERYHKITFLLNKITFNWQNSVIAVSQDVANSIKGNIKPKIPVEVILNGVNTDSFQRLLPDNRMNNAILLSNDIPENALIVGTVAVFRFQKRLKEWLQVFKLASDENPDLYGIIVGDGPLKNELLIERKRLGLEDRVLMPGLQINTVDWFSIMDIFMMTSEFEGLPIALLEAMSMNCAILTTDAGGIKEVIIHKENGLLVDVNQWKSLVEQLRIIKDKNIRLNLAKNAQKTVLYKFSLSRMVQSLEKMYTTIC